MYTLSSRPGHCLEEERTSFVPEAVATGTRTPRVENEERLLRDF